METIRITVTDAGRAKLAERFGPAEADALMSATNDQETNR